MCVCVRVYGDQEAHVMLGLHLRGAVASRKRDWAHSAGKYGEVDIQRREERTGAFPAQGPRRFDSWDTLANNESSEVMTSSGPELWLATGRVCVCVRTFLP